MARVHLVDVRWHTGTEAGKFRLLKHTRRDNNIGCLVSPVVCHHEVPIAIRLRIYLKRAYSKLYGQLEPIDVILQVGNNLGLAHKAIGLITPIHRSGQLNRPIWRDESKRIPAAIAPCVRGLGSLLDNDVLMPFLLQAVAHRQASLSATNNDGFDH